MDAFKQWEDFLDPAVTRGRLIESSLYIACFETLREAIVDHIRDFFTLGDERRYPHYASQVLKGRNRDPLHASLTWLKEQAAIDDQDLEVFQRAKACRNTIAHELLSTITGGLPSDFEQCFVDMVALLRKIEVWWIVNVEMPTSPDPIEFDGNEDDIIPGSIMVIQMMLDVALGDETESQSYLKEFRRLLKEKRASPNPDGGALR